VKIGFLVERPTQFEAPFYRFAAADPANDLQLFFTAAGAGSAAYDPELGREVSWGFDLLAGYPHRTLPATGRSSWLAEVLERERFDLLIVNGYTQRAYLAGRYAAHKAGVPAALRLDSILPFPGEERPLRDRAKRALYTAILRPAFDLFLGVGTLTLDFLRRCGVPEERQGLFPYAVDVEEFRRRSRLEDGEREPLRRRLLGIEEREEEDDGPILLSLAKLGEREAPWDLLHAFTLGAREPKAGRPWLVLAGDGPLRPHLEAFVHDRGLDRVRFPGYIPYPELPALYAGADLFVHPAREERWGVSVAEALACGLPVVTSSRVGAAHDLIRPGGNGYTYEAGDAADLARKIDRALALPQESVAAVNERVLAEWDYAASWRSILEAAARTAGRR
jgi:glycosyltransferase involved in cell wall biosynthesis